MVFEKSQRKRKEMKNKQYNNYFKKHYNYTLTHKDVSNYQKWFYPQWKIISRNISLDQTSKILEIGSGTGGFYNVISDRITYKNYMGIELDANAVTFSNNHFKSNVFTCISFENFNTSTKFDYIFAFEVLEHLDNPVSSLQKIHRLLKQDGTFIATTPYPFEKNILADKTHLYVLHPKNWERHFLNVGFTSVKVYPMSFLPFLWRVDKYFNFRIPFYVPLNGMISTCLFIAKK